MTAPGIRGVRFGSPTLESLYFSAPSSCSCARYFGKDACQERNLWGTGIAPTVPPTADAKCLSYCLIPATESENSKAGGKRPRLSGSGHRLFKPSASGRRESIDAAYQAQSAHDPANMKITEAMLNDPNFMIPFMRAIASGEAPRGHKVLSGARMARAYEMYQQGGAGGLKQTTFALGSRVGTGGAKGTLNMVRRSRSMESHREKNMRLLDR